MNVYPLDEVTKGAEERMRAGWTIYQQFNCGKCGIKQTIAEANLFFTSGKCEECGHVTDLVKAGCNYMAISEMGEGR